MSVLGTTLSADRATIDRPVITTVERQLLANRECATPTDEVTTYG